MMQYYESAPPEERVEEARPEAPLGTVFLSSFDSEPLTVHGASVRERASDVEGANALASLSAASASQVDPLEDIAGIREPLEGVTEGLSVNAERELAPPGDEMPSPQGAFWAG